MTKTANRMRYESFERRIIDKVGTLLGKRPDLSSSLDSLGINLTDLQEILGFVPQSDEKPFFVQQLWIQYCDHL